jgi:hypothetical protein
LALNNWKTHLPYVVNTINRKKPNFKSQLNLLLAFFTKPVTTILPQNQDRFYKFKIGERVRINLSKAERTALNFKYSLSFGTEICFFLYLPVLMKILCAGKLTNILGKINSRRLTQTSRNTLTPFYGVKLGASTQAWIHFFLPCMPCWNIC